MIIPEKERYRIACEKFLEEYPEVKKQLDSLNPKVAECLDITLEDYRQMELHEAFKRKAEFMGIDVYELVIRYLADSEEELKTMQMEYYEGLAKAMGMTLEDFCEPKRLELI